jgi:hypothetical protein
LIERDPVILAVGKEAIAPAIARPIEVELKTAADIGNDQERRGLVFVGQRQRITLRLNARVGHQPVIFRRAFALGRVMPNDIAKQIGDGLQRLNLLLWWQHFAFFELALLGFKDEAVAFVKIDALIMF